MYCPHENFRLVWTARSAHDGKPFACRRLRKQCVDCSSIFGEAQKHSLATPDTPELSLEEMTRSHREQEARYEAERAQREAEYEEARCRRRDEYHAYLQTPEWWSKRGLVMARASGLCEGCRMAKASEVHHLTYDHVRHEFLWELVAICRDCHQRLHDLEGK